MPIGQPASVFDEADESSSLPQWLKVIEGLGSVVSDAGLRAWHAAGARGHLVQIDPDSCWDGQAYGQTCVVAGGNTPIRGLGRPPAGYRNIIHV